MKILNFIIMSILLLLLLPGCDDMGDSSTTAGLGKCFHIEEASSCAIPCGPDYGCPAGYSCSADICWPEP